MKGATQVSEFLALSTGGAEVEIRRKCGFDDRNIGECSGIVSGVGSGMEFSADTTGTASLAPVAVDISTSSAPILPYLTAFIAIVPVTGVLLAL